MTHTVQVGSVEGDGAEVRTGGAGEQAQQGGLAGAVGSEQSDCLSGRRRDADVVDDEGAAAGPGYVVSAEGHGMLRVRKSKTAKAGTPIKAVTTPTGIS